MSSLLEFKTGTGESLLVEVDDSSGGPVTRGGRTAEVVVEAGARIVNMLLARFPDAEAGGAPGRAL